MGLHVPWHIPQLLDEFCHPLLTGAMANEYFSTVGPGTPANSSLANHPEVAQPIATWSWMYIINGWRFSLHFAIFPNPIELPQQSHVLYCSHKIIVRNLIFHVPTSVVVLHLNNKWYGAYPPLPYSLESHQPPSSQYHWVLNSTWIYIGKHHICHGPWQVWHWMASWSNLPHPCQMPTQYHWYLMALTKTSANTDPSQTTPLAVIPNLVQVAMQLPVQKYNQQLSPNKPTMMTPHSPHPTRNLPVGWCQ